jgi:predicted transglutaminase-like cysteine proteinase
MITVFRNLTASLLLVGLAGFYAAPASAKPVGHVKLTPERMAQLQRVNNHVNSTIVEVSDLEQYGREDVWTIPTSGKGDCEDFALLKRKLLIQQGWPASSMSLALGATAQGVTHAVLTVTTDQGEYVLDNLTSSILPPSQTGIVFHSRQSGRGWISASGERTSEPTADFPVAGRVPVIQTALRKPRS